MFTTEKPRTYLKGLITKAWNIGKYNSKKELELYLTHEFHEKYSMNIDEYFILLSHIEEICKNSPKIKLNKTSPKKKEHEKWFVYFYFSNIDNTFPQLTYIGKTYNIGNRLKQHQKEDEKFNNVDYVLFCEFKTERDALDFEAYYTRYFQPEWNIDNKEAPSKLYKLPAQKLKLWAPSTTIEDPQYHQILKDVKFMRSVLIPTYQEAIDAISA